MGCTYEVSWLENRINAKMGFEEILDMIAELCFPFYRYEADYESADYFVLPISTSTYCLYLWYSTQHHTKYALNYYFGA